MTALLSKGDVLEVNPENWTMKLLRTHLDAYGGDTQSLPKTPKKADLVIAFKKMQAEIGLGSTSPRTGSPKGQVKQRSTNRRSSRSRIIQKKGSSSESSDDEEELPEVEAKEEPESSSEDVVKEPPRPRGRSRDKRHSKSKIERGRSRQRLLQYSGEKAGGKKRARLPRTPSRGPVKKLAPRLAETSPVRKLFNSTAPLREAILWPPYLVLSGSYLLAYAYRL